MKQAERAAAWIYAGLWGVLSGLFRVPRDAPSPPSHAGGEARTFRPAEGYLRYLKFRFWIVLLVIDVGILIVWLVITAAAPIVGVILAIPALLIAVVPDVIAYLAIHLRYDTTWYVLSPRSMRLRRGVWSITETTITFENVQNITVQQGPLQRYFGIATVEVRTAGGGGASGPHGARSAASHVGLIEGVTDAGEIRDLIASRVRASRSAGLGDEGAAAAAGGGWSAGALGALREVAAAASGLRVAAGA